MTDERVEPTKEWLDALIHHAFRAPSGLNPDAHYVWNDISQRRIGAEWLRDAILASQPERVECPTNCKHGKWGHKFLPDGSGRTGWLTRQEIFRPYKSNFCPDCGQSLKGAEE